MDRAQSEIVGTPRGELERVAAASLGLPSAVVDKKPTCQELSTVHYDPRTIGIFRVTGTLREPSGREGAEWSAVAKVIDQSIKGPEGWVSPDQEVLSYTQGGFSDDGLNFRSAHCLHVSQREPLLTILWLEDLTSVAKPPFDVSQLSIMARHLGEWNGFHARHRRPFPFELRANAHAKRWRQSGFKKYLERFGALHDSPYARAAFGGLPRAVAYDLHEAGSALNAKVTTLDRSLAFGDCNVGNLFHTASHTVAVDWASLAQDPIGVDAGCMIGSAITFGARGSEIVAEEQQLFASYLHGIESSGMVYQPTQVRAAYLCLFAVYLFYSAMMPVLLQVPGEFFSREFYERRYRTKWEDIPRVVHGVVQALPRYVEEMRQLAR